MGWLVPLVVLAAGGWILAEAVLRSRRSPAEGWGDRPDAPVSSPPVPPAGATTWVEAAGTVPAEQASGWSPAPQPAWSQWPETRPAGSIPSPEARPAGSPTAPVLPPGPAAPAVESAWQPGPPGGTAPGWGPAPGAVPAPGWQPPYPL